MIIDLITGLTYTTVEEVPNGNVYWNTTKLDVNQVQATKNFIVGKLIELDGNQTSVKTLETGGGNTRATRLEWTDTINNGTEESPSIEQVLYAMDNEFYKPVEDRFYNGRKKFTITITKI